MDPAFEEEMRMKMEVKEEMSTFRQENAIAAATAAETADDADADVEAQIGDINGV